MLVLVAGFMELVRPGNRLGVVGSHTSEWYLTGASWAESPMSASNRYSSGLFCGTGMPSAAARYSTGTML